MRQFCEVVLFLILSIAFGKKLSEITEQEFGIGIVLFCAFALFVIIAYFMTLISNVKHSSEYEDL